MTQTIVLEKDENNNFIGRVYVEGRRTSAFVVYDECNSYLFSDEQISELTDETF
jgi:hypothetical protein